MSKSRGLVAAVLAYTAWGPLAPLGALLLEELGPFTLNAIRTAGTLLLFTATMGPRVLLRSFRLLAGDRRLWLLGTVGLGFTFGSYLGSLLFLDPTIAALLLYFSPIFVAWIAHVRLGERVPRLLFPAVGFTIVGSILAVFEPGRQIPIDQALGVGLALGALGVFGWTFYTVYLKHLGPRYSDQELTMTAFLTSGLVFLLAAIAARLFFADVPSFALELRVPSVEAAFWVELGVYILLPSFVSFQLYAVAVRQAGAALTATLLGIEIVATAVFSYFLTDERFSAVKLVGIAIVLVAVTGFLVSEARRPLPIAAPTPPAENQREKDP